MGFFILITHKSARSENLITWINHILIFHVTLSRAATDSRGPVERVGSLGSVCQGGETKEETTVFSGSLSGGGRARARVYPTLPYSGDKTSPNNNNKRYIPSLSWTLLSLWNYNLTSLNLALDFPFYTLIRSHRLSLLLALMFKSSHIQDRLGEGQGGGGGRRHAL